MHIPFCRKDKDVSLSGIGDNIHIGVGSDVVCSISMGMQEPRWVGRITDDSTLFCALHRTDVEMQKVRYVYIV